ncbi:MAG TPA: 30S ribosomal protein S20 [Limnochordia bacterium]
MANSRSAEKRVRTAARRRAYNRAIKSAMKTAVKNFRAALEAGDREKAASLLSVAFSRIDRAANKGVIHKNQARRRKSRLALLAAKQAG